MPTRTNKHAEKETPNAWMHWPVLLMLTAVLVGGIWLVRQDDGGASEGIATEEASTLSIEDQVRAAVAIPDMETFRSQLHINTQAALDDLRKNAPEPILRDAEVGDYYIVFSGRAIVFRPETKQVVYMASVVAAEVQSSESPGPTSSSTGQTEIDAEAETAQ